jgi:hypothetical protein
MTTEHADTLRAARAQMVDSRRGLAEALEKPYERGKTEEHRAKFFEIQAVIEAIDRAISDETKDSGESS